MSDPILPVPKSRLEELEAAEARCKRLERRIEQRDKLKRHSDLHWRRAAEEALAGNPQSLKNRIAMMDESPVGAALSDTAPDTWNPDHPDFAKTDTAQQETRDE